MTNNPQIVGNIGLYLACYELSKSGWNVMPTSRNAKGVDLIAYNQSGSRYLGIQVKSLSKKSPVPIGSSLEKVMGDFWIIVNNLEGTPRIFILDPNEVKILAYKGKTGSKGNFWLWQKRYMIQEFESKWDRIQTRLNGFSEKPIRIPIDDDFSFETNETHCVIYLRNVEWDGPNKPSSKLCKIKEIYLSDIEGFHSIEKEIEIAKANRKYFLTCSVCKKTTITGHMHDEKVCQGCAEKTGVVY